EHSLRRLILRAQLEIDRGEEQIDDVVLIEPALAPALVALTGVLADPRDCALGGDLLLEELPEGCFHVTGRQTAQERAASCAALSNCATGWESSSVGRAKGGRPHDPRP